MIGDVSCRRRPPTTMLTIIVLAAVLSACGQQSGVGTGSAPHSGDPTLTSTTNALSKSDPTTSVGSHPPTPPSTWPTDPGPLVVLPAEIRGGLDAEVRGRLVFRGTCVYLNPSYGGQLQRIVWPTGTTWREEPSPAVFLRNGTVLRDGDRLNAAGGGVSDVELGLNIGDDLAAKSFECDEAKETQIVNNDVEEWSS